VARAKRGHGLTKYKRYERYGTPANAFRLLVGLHCLKYAFAGYGYGAECRMREASDSSRGAASARYAAPDWRAPSSHTRPSESAALGSTACGSTG